MNTKDIVSNKDELFKAVSSLTQETTLKNSYYSVIDECKKDFPKYEEPYKNFPSFKNAYYKQKL